jgi:hypothetical protein
MGPLFFNIFIRVLRVKIHFSEFMLVADDFEIFRIMKSAEGYK